MIKAEAIKKISDACVRVLKQSDFASGVVTALTLVVARLTALRDQIQSAGEIDANCTNDMWAELYECGRVLDSIYNGFPMVPAEDVATLNPTDEEADLMEPIEMVAKCAAELEVAATEKGVDVVKRVATIQVALLKWAALGETDPEGAKIPFVKVDKIAQVLKACGDKQKDKMKMEADKEAAKKSADPAPSVPVVDDVLAKIEKIAKRADPVAPAPARTSWPHDLNG
jgi:hypothetical protein